MARPKKIKSEGTPTAEPKEAKIFGMEEAKKLASSYIPEDESKRYMVVQKDGKDVNVDQFDVMYVTSDKNVFYKANEGEARSHARKNKLELFKIEL